jgi:hypothetical protein
VRRSYRKRQVAAHTRKAKNIVSRPLVHQAPKLPWSARPSTTSSAQPAEEAAPSGQAREGAGPHATPRTCERVSGASPGGGAHAVISSTHKKFV